MVEAKFCQLRNDLYWELFTLEDGKIRWTGYDDDFWWNKVSTDPQFFRKVGKTTGQVYLLNPLTNEVVVGEKKDG